MPPLQRLSIQFISFFPPPPLFQAPRRQVRLLQRVRLARDRRPLLLLRRPQPHPWERLQDGRLRPLRHSPGGGPLHLRERREGLFLVEGKWKVADLF